MRSSSVLTALFSHVRQGVLAATLGQPDKWWYLSELADRLGPGPSSSQKAGTATHHTENSRLLIRASNKTMFHMSINQVQSGTNRRGLRII